MGSPCLFTRQQALKMGYFYWLHIKGLNHLHTELNLVQALMMQNSCALGMRNAILRNYLKVSP